MKKKKIRGYKFLLVFIAASVVSLAITEALHPNQIPLAQVITDLKHGKISSIDVYDDRLVAKYNNGSEVTSNKGNYDSIYSLFKDKYITSDLSKVAVNIRSDSMANSILNVISSILPLLVIIFIPVIAVLFFFHLL